MINVPTTARGRQGTQARGEDTRRRILETALDLFAAHGYEGASTRQIAEGAGVNLPAIQYYFGNKEGLYRAIIEDIVADTERHMSEVLPRVRTALDDPGATPAQLTELLCQMLEAFITVVTSGPHVMLHFISNMRLPGLEPATMEVFESQTFNEDGKIVHLRAYFDAQGLGRR